MSDLVYEVANIIRAEQREGTTVAEVAEEIDALYESEIERLRAALREIQFNDCCYEARVIADIALGDADETGALLEREEG